ncbi:SPATS2-like protein [Lineus longissimus]|uniref:SPATS2-like protein n=1 Tax=Lineus longissimus TaxID=88925 RepID=UPI002B4E6424
MAQPQQDGVKEKCQAVREVMPGKSNNEIILVLQYYDYNVETAIQAYVEDGAKEALREWHFSGTKLNNKKKKKNKAKPKEESPTPGLGDQASSKPSSETIQPKQPSITPAPKPVQAPVVRPPPKEEPSKEKASPPVKSKPQESQPEPHTHHGTNAHGHPHHGHALAHAAKRERTLSERSTSSISSRSVKPHAGLEKSYKDLQRQTTSLQRLKLVVNEEMDKSQKRIRSVVEELRLELNKREIELIADMEKAKQAALEILDMRQEKGHDLRLNMDRAPSMKDEEINELRIDVKHFVADRKVDEELGRTTRFLYDSDHLVSEISKFGEVLPVKASYSPRRPSISSIASSDISHNDLPSPSASLTAKSLAASQNSTTLLRDSKTMDGLTSSEVAELQMRLKDSLKLQGLPVKSPPNRRAPPAARDRPTSGNPGTQGSLRRGPPTGRPERSPRRAPPSGRPDQRGDGPAGDDSKAKDLDDQRKNRNARRRQRYRERQREARDSTGSQDNPRTDKPKPDTKAGAQSSSRAPKSPDNHTPKRVESRTPKSPDRPNRGPKSSDSHAPKIANRTPKSLENHVQKTDNRTPIGGADSSAPKSPDTPTPQSPDSVPVNLDQLNNTADVKPQSSPKLSASKTETEAPLTKPENLAPNALEMLASAHNKEVVPPSDAKENHNKLVNGSVVETKPKDVSVVSNGDASTPPLVNGDSHTEHAPDSPKDSNMNKLSCKLDTLETGHKEEPLPQRKPRERTRNEKMMNGSESVMNGGAEVENHVDN